MPRRHVFDPLLQVDSACFPAQLNPVDTRIDGRRRAVQGIDARDPLPGPLLRPSRAGHFGRKAPRKFRWISVDA